MSYESDDHKEAAGGFLTGVEQNIDDEDRLLEDQQAEGVLAKGVAEPERPPTRQRGESRPIGEVEPAALEESQVSANPAAGRIPDE